MQVPQLHDVLCGGHVLVDDPALYEPGDGVRSLVAELLREQ